LKCGGIPLSALPSNNPLIVLLYLTFELSVKKEKQQNFHSMKRNQKLTKVKSYDTIVNKFCFNADLNCKKTAYIQRRNQDFAKRGGIENGKIL